MKRVSWLLLLSLPCFMGGGCSSGTTLTKQDVKEAAKEAAQEENKDLFTKAVLPTMDQYRQEDRAYARRRANESDEKVRRRIDDLQKSHTQAHAAGGAATLEDLIKLLDERDARANAVAEAAAAKAKAEADAAKATANEVELAALRAEKEQREREEAAGRAADERKFKEEVLERLGAIEERQQGRLTRAQVQKVLMDILQQDAACLGYHVFAKEGIPPGITVDMEGYRVRSYPELGVDLRTWWDAPNHVVYFAWN